MPRGRPPPAARTVSPQLSGLARRAMRMAASASPSTRTALDYLLLGGVAIGVAAVVQLVVAVVVSYGANITLAQLSAGLLLEELPVDGGLYGGGLLADGRAAVLHLLLHWRGGDWGGFWQPGWRWGCHMGHLAHDGYLGVSGICAGGSGHPGAMWPDAGSGLNADAGLGQPDGPDIDADAGPDVDAGAALGLMLMLLGILLGMVTLLVTLPGMLMLMWMQMLGLDCMHHMAAPPH
ncbi:hypothetical protein DTO166G4_8679 [Paecilomyces variotii]|nr:hypothetical protein DTO166G4_8679 [Paecilomyces variotii]KAJ9228758.1 hypothetical protein DTO166G5_8356 [Paecilomyces variotii]